MSILKVIKTVIMVCEQHNKPIKNIFISDTSLLVTLDNNSDFTIYYRNMTENDIESLVSTCCNLSSNILN